jgi:hypothetical protein
MNKMTVIPKTKTLDDVKTDMSELYEQLREGTVEVKLASELANITGKYLKAEQLKLAREIFDANTGQQMIG